MEDFKVLKYNFKNKSINCHELSGQRFPNSTNIHFVLQEEAVSAQSIAFSRDGVKLYAGFDKCIRVYDITHLGDKPERRPRLGSKFHRFSPHGSICKSP